MVEGRSSTSCCAAIVSATFSQVIGKKNLFINMNEYNYLCAFLLICWCMLELGNCYQGRTGEYSYMCLWFSQTDYQRALMSDIISLAWILWELLPPFFYSAATLLAQQMQKTPPKKQYKGEWTHSLRNISAIYTVGTITFLPGMSRSSRSSFTSSAI